MLSIDKLHFQFNPIQLVGKSPIFSSVFVLNQRLDISKALDVSLTLTL